VCRSAPSVILCASLGAMRWPPFEPLPAEPRALRLRGLRDGLIISGWLTTAFVYLVVTDLGRSFGYDAFAYWSLDLGEHYGRAMLNNKNHGGFG
jgi:hypothetical protein